MLLWLDSIIISHVLILSLHFHFLHFLYSLVQCVITCASGAHMGLLCTASKSLVAADAGAALLFRVGALSEDGSLSLYNMLVQHKIDRLKLLTAEQKRQLHDVSFCGSPRRVCLAASYMCQPRERKDNYAFSEVIAFLARHDEASRAPPNAFQSQAAQDAWSLALTRASSQNGAAVAPRSPLPWSVIRLVLVESFNAIAECAHTRPLVADEVDKFVLQWWNVPMCSRDATGVLVLTGDAFSVFFEWFKSCAELVRRFPVTWGKFVPLSQGSAAHVSVFLGFLTGAEANERLQGRPAGSFLLRFSESCKSTVTLSRVDASGRLEHNRIVCTASADGGRFGFETPGSVKYATLEECILSCSIISHVWPGYEKRGVF
jgi:hypothetical protein